MTTVKCPTCNTPVPWTPESRYRPFCSERCRLIDLGEWFEGGRNIPGEEIDAEAIGLIERNSDWPANHE